jgi:hypothetical protein
MVDPRTEKQWVLKENGREIKDKEEIAEVCNQFYTSKIINLKANIKKECT